jgi:alkylation response protein AidB-like acyl-CoA dehydrogenase
MHYPKTARQAELIALADSLAARIAPRAEAVARENVFPYENFRELHQAGYLALTIPREMGGLGADLLEFVLAHERIARACGATALAANMHLTVLARLGETGIWPAEIVTCLCRDVVARGALINQVNSEPDLGSPSRGGLPATTAERTPDGWVINGHKR